jgi:hypothetical protein
MLQTFVWYTDILPCRLYSGRTAAFKFAERVKRTPSPGAAFWTAYCTAVSADALEALSQKRVSKRAAIQEVSLTFESAVLSCGASEPLVWMAWIRFLKQTSQNTTHIVQRANHTLPDDVADDFSLRVQQLQ